jgi:hypothetical protein
VDAGVDTTSARSDKEARTAAVIDDFDVDADVDATRSSIVD